MGWLFRHRPSSESVKAFLQKHINCENEHGTMEALDIAIVQRTTAYVALRATLKGKPACVLGGVYLLQYARGFNNLGIKELEESVEPFSYDCPERILRILTPLDAPEFLAIFSSEDKSVAIENAGRWREKCWANIQSRKRLAGLKPGMRLRHPTGISYGGVLVKEFVILDPRTTVVAGPQGYGRYRLRKAMMLKCEIVADPSCRAA